MARHRNFHNMDYQQELEDFDGYGDDDDDDYYDYKSNYKAKSTSQTNPTTSIEGIKKKKKKRSTTTTTNNNNIYNNDSDTVIIEKQANQIEQTGYHTATYTSDKDIKINDEVKSKGPNNFKNELVESQIDDTVMIDMKLAEAIEGLLGDTSDLNIDLEKHSHGDVITQLMNPDESLLQREMEDQGIDEENFLRNTNNSSKNKKMDVLSEYEKYNSEKPEINLVVVGHVDSGKSTLMGHLLYMLGDVNKRIMHKYEKESKQIGKGSFAYAWVLDEGGEERERGVTIDVAMKSFETDNRRVTLLDAPGHKDFVPNMITGASQADFAILVIDAVKGAFEAGFKHGGQTKEHALLLQSLGVSKLIIAVNKMDQCDWNSERFNEIQESLKVFLKQCGFKDGNMTFIPICGLEGGNLIAPLSCHNANWYTGKCLIECIDTIPIAPRPIEKPLRFFVASILTTGSNVSIAGRVETGYIQIGDKVLIVPSGKTAVVKGIQLHESSVRWAAAGMNAIVALLKIDVTDLCVGCVACPIDYPIRAVTIITTKIIVFTIEKALIRGYTVELYHQSVCEAATIIDLISLLNKANGEVIKKNPKAIPKNSSAIIKIETAHPICADTYQNCKEVGRIAMRSGGVSVAAGIIIDLVQ